MADASQPIDNHDTAEANVSAQIHSVGGKDLCRIHVKPSSFPVEATVIVVKEGQHLKKTAFHVRLNNKTHDFLDDDEKLKFIARRWGADG